MISVLGYVWELPPTVCVQAKARNSKAVRLDEESKVE